MDVVECVHCWAMVSRECERLHEEWHARQDAEIVRLHRMLDRIDPPA